MGGDLTDDEIGQLLAAIPAEGKELKTEQESEVLTIEGDVREERICSGPVIITGRALPGSLIRTDGIVTVRGGIRGALIQAGKGINAPYAEMSTLISEGDILITSHMLACTVRCAGGIYGSAGSFINGGDYRAYYTIQADVLGHPFGSATSLSLVKSDSRLFSPYDRERKGDHLHHKIAARKKVWQGTRFAIHDYHYSPPRDLEGPFDLDIAMMGGSL